MRTIVLGLFFTFSTIAFAESSYVVQQPSVLTVQQDLSAPPVEIILSPGDTLVFLEQMQDEQGNVWWHFGKEQASYVEEESEVFDFWVNEEDLSSLFLFEEILGRMTYCYRYVKKYLLKKGFVKMYLPGVSAYMAATVLPKYGFRKTSRLPQQALIYDVCVYKGGPAGHGHVEVLDPKGWYYGYGYFKNPISNRVFLGCFYKPKNLFE